VLAQYFPDFEGAAPEVEDETTEDEAA